MNSIAPTLNSTVSQNVAGEIGGYMQTNCTNNQLGSTYVSNIASGINYAKNHGYPNSYAISNVNSSLSPLLGTIKNEINAGRPIIVNTNTHSLVAYGYSNAIGSQVIRVNYGWGPNYANKDVSMGSLAVNTTISPINSYVQYVIQ